MSIENTSNPGILDGEIVSVGLIGSDISENYSPTSNSTKTMSDEKLTDVSLSPKL